MPPLNALEKQYKEGSVCKYWKAGYDKCKDITRAFQDCFDPFIAGDGTPPCWPDIHDFLWKERGFLLARFKTPALRDKYAVGFDAAHKNCTDVGTFKDWQKKQESGQLVFDKS